MIIRELYTQKADGTKLFRTYSNAGYYIKKRNSENLYTEAIDVAGVRFHYEETDILIPVKEEKKVEETTKEE